MELSSTNLVVLSIICFLFSFYFLFLKPKSNTHKSPPEAGGAWPILGHVELIAGGSSTRLPHVILAEMAEKYGPMFTVRFGTRRALILNHPEFVKEIFTTYDTVVSTRPRFRAAIHLGYNSAMFGFAPYGPYWRQIRKLITIELMSSRKVEMQHQLYISETREFINELYTLWEEKRDGSGKIQVEMQKWFGDLNLNVILLMVAGKRFFGGHSNKEESKRCIEIMRDFFHLNGQIVPADCLPFVGWLDLGGFEKKMKKTATEMDELVGKWLEEHKQNECSNKSKTEDFMDVMLSSIPDDPFLKDQFDLDTIIKATSAVLIAGATDTNAVMLVWILCLLLNNCRVLQKAQEEVDIQVGKDRLVNESDINNLVYLRALIKETLRLYPAGALGGLREFTEDCTVGGYHIPKGTWLMTNLRRMQCDPSIWPDDPLEFKPERFLTVHKDVDIIGQDFELIPYGTGRRMCPGIHLSIQMLIMITACFLQAFEISSPDGEMVDMAEIPGLTNSKATPLDVLLAPRLSHTLF